MKLFLAEHSYQVDDLINRLDDHQGQWIALGPSAMYCLDERSIPYQIPEDYCSRDEVDKACVKQFEKLSVVCSRLDQMMLDRESFLRERNIQPFLFHLWQIAMIVDGIVGRTIQIRKILDQCPGAGVYAHIAGPKPWAIFGLGFSKEEALWGRLLSVSPHEGEVELFSEPRILSSRVSESIPKRIGKSFKNILRKAFRENFITYNFIQSYRHGIWKDNFTGKSLFGTSKRNWVVCSSGFFEWTHLLPFFVKHDYRIYFLGGERGLSLPGEKSADIEFHEKLWHEFAGAFEDPYLAALPIIKDRIFWIAERATGIAENVFRKLEDLLADKDISLTLVSSTATYFNYLVKQLCQWKRIPVITWQHGTTWYDERITQRVDLHDLIGTNVLLTYGEGCKRAYEKSGLQDLCRVEAVGNISLEKIRHSRIPITEDRKILYVITGYYRNGWYCGFEPSFNDRLYFREQTHIVKRLLETIEAIEGINLTVKLYPNAVLLDEDPPWIRDLHDAERVTLVRSGVRLDDLIASHDVIIIDAPTTTLLQAIAGSRPVFALTSIISPPKTDLPALKERAVCGESAEELMDALVSYLRTGKYPADVNNREFLRLYGTHFDDGRSSKRVRRVLSDILPTLLD